jgi:hypothetical protein
MVCYVKKTLNRISTDQDEKILVIVEANAVIQPHAMVIKTLNTLIAVATVLHSFRYFFTTSFA